MTSNCPHPSLQGPLLHWPWPTAHRTCAQWRRAGAPSTPSRPGQPLMPSAEERQAPFHGQGQCPTWRRKIVKARLLTPFRVKPHPTRAWPPRPWPRRWRCGWGEVRQPAGRGLSAQESRCFRAGVEVVGGGCQSSNCQAQEPHAGSLQMGHWREGGYGSLGDLGSPPSGPCPGSRVASSRVSSSLSSAADMCRAHKVPPTPAPFN